jgi:hypothetical protein
LEVLTLPSGRASCGSTSALFEAISDLFVVHGIPPEAARLFAHFTACTWFPELLPIAPCVVIRGPRPEAHLALGVLGSVVRHGLFLTEITMRAFGGLPMHLQLTLLIGCLKPSVHQALGASIFPRAYLPCSEGLMHVCCAKAVYAGARAPEGLSDQSVLRIDLPPSQKRLPVIDVAEQQEIAAEFQPRLVDFRFTRAGKCASLISTRRDSHQT